jgi:RNA polymerase sigma-70 factor (sigma-E family)
MDAVEFTEFVAAHERRLRRTAYLLCGDWSAAEDLVQTVLGRMYGRWRRIRQYENLPAYARRVLLNEYIAEYRRRGKWERVMAAVPDHTAPDHSSDLKLTMLDALAKIPPRMRAVLVLRYWEDQSVEAAAATLGCSVGNIKSQSSRGLAKLREALGEQVPEHDHQG